MQVRLLVLKKWIPCLTIGVRMNLESLKILSSSAFQLNLLLGLIKSPNGFLILLDESAHATWLTKPNHDLAL